MITRVLKALWRSERNTIDTHTERCCRNRDRHSTCRRCVDACPVQALEIDDGLQLDLERCLECGTCAAVCPTGALEVRVPSNEQLLSDARQRLVDGYRDIVFGCNRNAAAVSGGNGSLIHTSCLGRLDESVLVGVVALGARSVGLLMAACASCPHSNSHAIAEAAVERSRDLIQVFGSSAEIRFVQEMPAIQRVRRPETEKAQPSQPSGTMSRRDLFRGFLRDATRTGTEVIGMALELDDVQPVTQAKIGMSTALPPKRLLLRSGLRRIDTGERSGSTIRGEKLWASVAIGESCTGCQMCAYFCPTGALRRVDESGRRGVEFSPSACVDCHLCVDVCRENAIVLSHDLPVDSVLGEQSEILVWRDAPGPDERTVGRQRLEDALKGTLGL